MRFLNILRIALAQVFVRPAYAALAAALALAAFLLAVWMPNLGLIARVLLDSGASPAAALGIALSLVGGISTNFSALAAGYTVAIAVLFGVTAAMIVYTLRQRRAAAGQGIVVGSGGMASGVIGIGCAACGSLMLGALFPALGATAALAALPLQGEEFGLVSVAMLLVSLALVCRNIAASSACRTHAA